MCGPYASTQWSAEVKKNQEKFAPFKIGSPDMDYDWINDEKNNTIATSSWPKLSSKHKLQKLQEYAIRYCKENKLDKELCKLKLFLKNSKHHLQKTKDVTYDKKTQMITGIPRLEFKQNRFILHKENRQSTTKGLLKKPNKTKHVNKTKKMKEVKEVKDAIKVQD